MILERVTIAVTHLDAMVRFYNEVFDAELVAIRTFGTHRFFSGKLAGVDLLLCPNEIAGVAAQQNRQQFRIAVDDLDGALAKVLEAGGQQKGDLQRENSSRVIAVMDPDGNTLELIQHFQN